MSDPSVTKFAIPTVQPGTVVVAERESRGLAQMLLDGRHQLPADEPAADGGEDSGPGPYELLLMALGSCTSMTVRLFARRRNWPLERVVVRLRHSRSHARDCANCNEHTSALDHIDVELTLDGNLDEAQRTRLLEIARKCPIHRTFTSSIEIAISAPSPAGSDV